MPSSQEGPADASRRGAPRAQLPEPSPFALAHRFGVLLGLIGRAAWLYLRLVLDARGVWRLSRERSVEIQRRFAERFVRVAMRFRGALIKIGQVASLRIDVVPEEVTDELARLQDRVEPHPFEEIAAQIESELGRPLEAVFPSFDRTPIASASLGQVHRARDAQGRDLAVKVLYPGIERQVAVDIAATRIGLWLFDWLVVPDLMQVYRELRRTILGEMDYLEEGRAAEEMGANLGRDPQVAERVRVPAIHWETTTRRVLTMEFLEGTKVNDTATIEAWGLDVNEVVTWATRSFLHMMLRDGFFHCDPHPGNLLVDRDGRLGIVDFGMNARIAPELREAIRKNVIASIQRDPEAYVDSLLEVGFIQPSDRDAAVELAKLGFDPRYYNLTPAEAMKIDLGEYLGEMRANMKKIKSFQLPDGVVMLGRAINLLYALALELAPGIRPLEVVGPYVLEFMAGPLPPAPGTPRPVAATAS
jgi:predicted unusual protein kinase regulating ubiquinone biosynthesis (AarF/ABC1/UbiB family)